MERVIRWPVFGLILLLLAAHPAAAQTETFVRLREAIEASAGAAQPPVRIGRERCTLVIAVNKSANRRNGIPGQRIREGLRGLMNEFWVDGEQFRIIPFQLSVDPPQDFTFQARERQQLYDRVDTLSSSAGDMRGGSDVEQAKLAVIEAMDRVPGAAVGLVFTNHDRSQEPISTPPGWIGLWLDHNPAAQLEELSRRAGVAWSKYQLARDGSGDEPAFTWVHVGIRGARGQSESLSQERSALVSRQNAENPPARAIRIRTARRLSATRIELEWSAAAASATGFLVRVRQRGSAAVLREFPAGEERVVVDLPAARGWYEVRVAAADAQGQARGEESDPVSVEVKGPAPPSWLPAVLALLVLVPGAVIWLRWPLRVQVNGTLRDLRPGGSIGVVTPGASTKGPDDVELTHPLEGHQGTVARLQRTLAGAVTVAAVGKDREVESEGGLVAGRATLKRGLQRVTIRDRESGSRLVDLDVEVGRRRASEDEGAA
jgi:hypothetical protein